MLLTRPRHLDRYEEELLAITDNFFFFFFLQQQINWPESTTASVGPNISSVILAIFDIFFFSPFLSPKHSSQDDALSDLSLSPRF